MDKRSTSHDGIRLRSIKADDHPDLLRIFIISKPELGAAVAHWDRQSQNLLLGQQFQIQLDQYQTQYPQGRFDVILAGEMVIGHLFTAQMENCLHLVDISLLPEYRNKGIGSSLILDLLSEAGAAGMEVTLHVLKDNRATRLYGRLGFMTAAETGPYQTMEWCNQCGQEKNEYDD